MVQNVSFGSTSSFASTSSVASSQWEADGSNCAICNGKFNLVKRRHHCRKCGRCVCNACSPNRVQMHGLRRSQRICSPCVGNSMAAAMCWQERCAGMAVEQIPEMASLQFSGHDVAPPAPNLAAVPEAAAPHQDAPSAFFPHDAQASGLRTGDAPSTANGHVKLPILPLSSISKPEADPDRPRSLTLATPLTRRGATPEEELERVYDFLTDFADRLEDLKGHQTVVDSFIMSPHSTPVSKTFDPQDLDHTMVRCEACISQIAESVHQLERFKIDEAELRAAYTRYSSRLKSIALAFSRAANSPGPNFESADAVEVCEEALAALEDSVPRLKRTLAGSKETTLGQEDSPAGIVLPSPEWEADKDLCTVCESKLGKRHFNPRHRCRACGKCVCASCSPSMVKIGDDGKVDRVCNPCVSSAFSAMAATPASSPSKDTIA